MPSSVIRRMRYFPGAQTLEIAFRDNRGVYRYFDVPAAEWMRFRAASSKGTYLNQTFKGGGYGYRKLAQLSEAEMAADKAPDLCWGES